jgi:hypothetical protein
MRWKLLLTVIFARISILSLALMSAPVLGSPQAIADDPVVAFSSGDPVMNAAIEKARSSLPVFWSKLADHTTEEDSFALKIAISEGEELNISGVGKLKGMPLKPVAVFPMNPKSFIL